MGSSLRGKTCAKRLAGLALAVSFGFSHLPSARADPASKIYLPQAVYGEWELEMRGGFENWDRHDGGNAQQYVFDIGRGITSRWFSELAFFYSKTDASSGELDEIKSENIFVLTEPGQYWLDIGLIAEYVRNRAEHVNEIEFGPLLQKEIGNEQFNLNFEFERELVGGAETELTYGWQWKHRGNPLLEWGLQGFGEFGEIDDLGHEHVHKIGPALFGQMRTAERNKIKYDAALLFGVTNSTPDTTLRVQFEYEMY